MCVCVLNSAFFLIFFFISLNSITIFCLFVCLFHFPNNNLWKLYVKRTRKNWFIFYFFVFILVHKSYKWQNVHSLSFKLLFGWIFMCAFWFLLVGFVNMLFACMLSMLCFVLFCLVFCMNVCVWWIWIWFGGFANGFSHTFFSVMLVMFLWMSFCVRMTLWKCVCMCVAVFFVSNCRLSAQYAYAQVTETTIKTNYSAIKLHSFASPLMQCVYVFARLPKSHKHCRIKSFIHSLKLWNKFKNSFPFIPNVCTYEYHKIHRCSNNCSMNAFPKLTDLISYITRNKNRLDLYQQQQQNKKKNLHRLIYLKLINANDDTAYVRIEAKLAS